MEPTSTTHLTADDGTRLAVHLTRLRRHRCSACPAGRCSTPATSATSAGSPPTGRCARLDLRGTGASDTPADPASYRCDRQVADVEAVRRHLGLDRLDLLAHSAGANLAYAYAAAHPDRVARLVLVAPSVRGLDIEITDEARSEIARLREGEPWYAEAAAALARVQAGAGGEPTGPRSRRSCTAGGTTTSAPTTPGWTSAATTRRRWRSSRTVPSTPSPPAPLSRGSTSRSGAGRRARLRQPGAGDGRGRRGLPARRLVVQEGAGHFPWVDDPRRVRAAAGALLERLSVS